MCNLETSTDAFGVELLPQCAKCRTTDAMEFTPIEYPEDDGTTTTLYGCDRCIDEMCDFLEARVDGMKRLKEAGYA